MNTEIILMVVCGVLLVVLYLREMAHAKERQDAEVEARRKVLDELKPKIEEKDRELNRLVNEYNSIVDKYSDVLSKYGIDSAIFTAPTPIDFNAHGLRVKPFPAPGSNHRS